MYLTLSEDEKITLFVSLFQHMHTINDTIEICINESRFLLQTMDSSRTSLIELCLPMTWFEKYSAPIEHFFSVRAKLFYTALNLHRHDQTLKISVDDENADNIVIEHNGGVAGQMAFDMRYEVPIADSTSELTIVNETETDVDIKIDSSYFSNIINIIKTIGSEVVFNCEDEYIDIKCEGEATGNINIRVPVTEMELYTKIEGQLKVRYGIKWLVAINNYVRLFKNFIIGIKGDGPLKILFKLCNNEEIEVDDETGIMRLPSAYMRYYLAPKIDE